MKTNSYCTSHWNSEESSSFGRLGFAIGKKSLLLYCLRNDLLLNFVLLKRCYVGIKRLKNPFASICHTHFGTRLLITEHSVKPLVQFLKANYCNCQPSLIIAVMNTLNNLEPLEA